MNKVGGVSAIAFGVGYVAIFPLYASVGAPPNDGAAWLDYGAGKTTAWWAILGLSVLTDFLLILIALALYGTLVRLHRTATTVGVALVGSFVVLDLAVTWSNFAALITLTERYATATTDAARAAALGAAEYATAVLSSPIFGIYSIATLSSGILLIGWVMRRSPFGTTAGYLGVATGLLGITSVAGPLVIPALGSAIIVASVLTTAWVLLIGYRLYRDAPAVGSTL